MMGINMFLTAVFFRIFKSQDAYFLVLIVLMVIAISWLTYAPESPEFLIQTNDYDKLTKCLRTVMQFNKQTDEPLL